MDERRQSEKERHQGWFGGIGCPRSRFYPLLILLLGVLVYSNTLDVPFTFDDEYYITENPAVRDFGYFLDHSFMEQGIAKGQLDQNFRSRRVAAFSFTVNYWLAGLQVAGYHSFNLLLHLINALLVYWLVILTQRTPFFADGSGDERLGGQGLRAALLVALFFVAHPVQTEAVTYISQRFTSMSTMFYLLALDLFIIWRLASFSHPREFSPVQSNAGWLPRPVLYCSALLSTLLAMFTKEIAFTLPVVVVIYDGMFFGWPPGRRLWYLLPFLLTLLVIPATILGGSAKYMDVVGLTSSLTEPMSGNPALTYLLTQFRVIVTYLRLLLLPVEQNIDYDYPLYTEFFQAPVTVSFVFLCLLAGMGVYLYCRSASQPAGQGCWQRLVSFGICWFFLTLSLESTIIPLNDLIFEHRMYLPSVGFFLAMLGAGEIAMKRFALLRTTGALLLLVAVLVSMAAAAYARNNLWSDPVALWEDAVRKSPDKWRPHNNLGKEYAKEGRLIEAEREFRQALKINDGVLMAYMNLGALYIGLGKIDLALESLDRAAFLDPSNPEIYSDIGIALSKKGDHEAAAWAFQYSLQLDPSDAETREKLESVLQVQPSAAAK